MPEMNDLRNPHAAFPLFIFLFWVVFCPAVEPEKKAHPPSKIVRVNDPQAVHLFQTDPIRVKSMMEKAIVRLTEAKDVSSAWKKFVQPSDTVGIKIHSAPGGFMATRKSVIEAVIDGVASAGVPRNRIIIFDRYGPTMQAAGFNLGDREDGVSVQATVPDIGYDKKVVLDLPVPGKLIWGDYEFDKDLSEKNDQLSTKSYFTRIVTTKVNKIINIGVPIDDPAFGIYGCVLGSSLSFVDNYRRFEKHLFPLDESIAEIGNHPIVQKKVALHIMDALTVQFAGGPGFYPQYCWQLGSLYVGNDPVAMDCLALDLMNQKRPSFEINKIELPISYLKTAQEAGLGTTDIKKIEVIDTK